MFTFLRHARSAILERPKLRVQLKIFNGIITPNLRFIKTRFMTDHYDGRHSPRLMAHAGQERSYDSPSKGKYACLTPQVDSKRRRDEKEEDKQSDRMMVDKPNEGTFSSYPAIKEETISKLKAKGITSLFPIQSGTFQIIYDRHDLIARDLTGSGKTLAFALPLVEKFRDRGYFKRRNGDLLAIMLAPTRELAL